MLDDADESRITGEWNNTGREYPRNATLKCIVFGQALRTPNAIAVRDNTAH